MLPDFTTVERHRSILESLDCSEEFSLNCWLRLRRLLDESEASNLVPGQTSASERRRPISKVKAATTDQHLARNVV